MTGDLFLYLRSSMGLHHFNIEEAEKNVKKI
jgi:hypothetical protein